MNRCGCLLLGLAIFLVVKGGQGLHTAATNREPTVVKLEDYEKTRPAAAWLKLTDCELSLIHSSWRSNKHDQSIKELFIPARVPGKPKEKAVVVVATKDAELIKVVKSLSATKGQAEALKAVVENRDKVFQKRDVSGLVRSGVDLSESDRIKLRSADPSLSQDFVILDEGSEPSALGSIGMLLGGGLLLLITLASFVAKPSADGGDPGAPPAPPAAA